MEKRLEYAEDEEVYAELSDDLICNTNMAEKELVLLQQCAPTLEYEEVILKRGKHCRQLGLTLCYGTVRDENCDTDIFIGQIEPGGLAEKDGRIHVGDQILQINGITIHTRKAAIQEFSKPTDRIILLLARACENEDEDDEDEEEDVEVDEGLVLTNANGALSPLMEQEDGHSAENSGVEKDSGLSRGTDSDVEVVPAAVSTTILPSVQPKSSREASRPARILEQTLEQELSQLHKEMETIRLECDRLIKKQTNTTSQLSTSMTETTQQAQLKSAFPPRSRANVNEQPNNRIAPSKTSNSLNNRKWSQVKSPPMPNKFQPPSHQFINRFLSNGRQPRHFQPDEVQAEASSSAYNTGGDSLDSCRSTPLKGDYATQCNTMYATEHRLPLRRPLHLTMAERRLNIGPTEHKPAYPILSPAENPYHTIETPTSTIAVQFRLPKLLVNYSPTEEQPPQQLHRSNVSGPTRQTFSNNGVVFRPGDKMFTSPDKLAETIALQQRLLRQTMIDQANIISAAANAVATPRPSARNNYSSSQTLQNFGSKNVGHKNTVYLGEANEVGQYEWKVKRRADGTRYITRRPLRSRVLKAREEQLNKERLGVSTDDDAASDLLKAGKFWSREDRKRHIERNKERKQKHNRMLNEKLQTGTADRQILQLSQRKQQRKISHQLFDKFTTIQEYLVHGVGDPTNQQMGAPLGTPTSTISTSTITTTTMKLCGMCMHVNTRIVDTTSLPVTQADGTGQDGCPIVTVTCRADSTDAAIALTWYDSTGATVDNTFGAERVTAVLQCSTNNQLTLNNVVVREVECLTI